MVIKVKWHEALFNRLNKEKILKWRRAGLEGDIVKYNEARDYTPEEVIQTHYIEVMDNPPQTEISYREIAANESYDSNDWRTEDESRFYRSNIEEPDYEANLNYPNVEESDHEAERRRNMCQRILTKR